MKKYPPYFDVFIPESSKLSSPSAMNASKESYTEGNAGKIWFLENGRVSNALKEKYFPRVDEDGNPIYITNWLSREWVSREFVKNNRKLSAASNSAWWTSFQNRSYATSSALNMANKVLEREGKTLVQKPIFNEESMQIFYGEGGVSSLCRAGQGTKKVNITSDAVYKVPSCLNQDWYPKLNELNLGTTPIKTVTGMDKMTVKELVIPIGAETIDPHGLPQGLERIDMFQNKKITEITGLENTKIKDIHADVTNIIFIDPEGVPSTLEDISLERSKLRILGGPGAGRSPWIGRAA